MKCIAVDWSGASNATQQKRGIWLAEAEAGQLVTLRSGMTREQVIRYVIESMRSHKDTVIGLDFAFSYPEWFLRDRGLVSAPDLWALAATEGETWLDGSTWPFWGRPGPYEKKPPDLTVPMQFRHTEFALKGAGYQPKSVFQVYGAGAVGTGSIRGMPYLRHLRDAGAAVWPFDAVKLPLVVEIYPASLLKDGNASTSEGRGDYLARHYSDVAGDHIRTMTQNRNAFDAGVSALVMSKHADCFRQSEPARNATEQLEGRIWTPADCP